MERQANDSLRPGSVGRLRDLSVTEWQRALAGDPVEAAALLERAAHYGLVEAQTLFGQILLDGRGVTKDASRAYRWFRIAADAGYAPGMNMAGRCLELGWGVGRDWGAAAARYRGAAEASLDWGQYNLANMLLRGRGVRLDRGQALTWYLRAAYQGHAKSMNLVGRFLEEGWEVPQDREAAVGWYRKAAELGDFRAQFNLATWLLQQDRASEAMSWLRQAALTGSVDFLQDLLGWIGRASQAWCDEIKRLAEARLADMTASSQGVAQGG
jgi:uncharacterized protein